MLLFWKRECIKVKIDFEHSLFLFPPIFLSFQMCIRDRDKDGILLKLPKVPDDIDYVIELIIK